MTKKKQKKTRPLRKSQAEPVIRNARAPDHGNLHDNRVHVFVDDQNLFWGIVNQQYGPGFRIDFGRLLVMACQDSNKQSRFVKRAYIAGVVPEDDSFWKIAENQGFTVRRGYLSNNRSKQDDAYLITELMETIYEQEGPSTIVLIAGDADYAPPLEKALEKGWRNEVAFIDRGIAETLEPVVHEFRTITPHSIQYLPGR